MIAEYLSELDIRFHTRPNKGRRMQLISPFLIRIDENRFEIPIAFWTDFASIPRGIWPIISPYELGKGCVPHDFGYYTGLMDKAFWDNVFLACMKHDKISMWKRFVAYVAVDKFGWKTWNRYRSQGTTAEQFARLDQRPCTDEQILQ